MFTKYFGESKIRLHFLINYDVLKSVNEFAQLNMFSLEAKTERTHITTH